MVPMPLSLELAWEQDNGFIGGEDGLVNHFLKRHIRSAVGEQTHEFVNGE